MGLMVALANITSGIFRGHSEQQIKSETLRALNPTSGTFASVQVPVPGAEDGIRVGLGGMPRAMLALITELVAGEEVFTGNEPYGGGFTSLSGRAERLMRFGEARPAPVLGLLTDLATRKDFIGYNTDITTPDGIRRLVQSNTLPIFLQNMIEDFDLQNWQKSLALTGFGALGLNSRDVGTTDVREASTRQVYPSATYSDLDSWEKTYVKSLAQPRLQALYEERIAKQAGDITYANKGLQSIQYRTEREDALLSLALNPQVETAAKYFAWIRADSVEYGLQRAVQNDYALIFGERSDDQPEGELEKAYAMWKQVLELDDADQKDRALAAFERAYPPTSEVGQYIRRQTNQRRVPMALLQELSNYAKARGVLYSVYARASELYRKVNLEEGPEAARDKMNDYLRWAFMLDEQEAMIQTMVDALQQRATPTPQPALPAAVGQ